MARNMSTKAGSQPIFYSFRLKREGGEYNVDPRASASAGI